MFVYLRLKIYRKEITDILLLCMVVGIQAAKPILVIYGLVTEPRHDKTNKMTVRPAKTQISLGIRPV